MTVRKTVTVVLAIVLAALSVGTVGAADGKGKGKNKDNKKAADTAKPPTEAQKAVDAAKKHFGQARQNLTKIQDDMKILAEKAKRARTDVQTATQNLRDRETDVEQAEPADTPFGKARDAYQQAQKAYREAEDRVLHSQKYLDAYEAAKRVETGALAKIRKEALDDDTDVQEARRKLEEAKAAYQPLRQEALQKDLQWSRMEKELQDKKREQDDAEQKARSKANAEKSAVAEMKRASEAVAAANGVAQQKPQQKPQAKPAAKHGKKKHK